MTEQAKIPEAGEYDSLLCLRQEGDSIRVDFQYDERAALPDHSPDLSNRAVFAAYWLRTRGQPVVDLIMDAYKTHHELAAARHNLAMLSMKPDEDRLRLVSPSGERIN